MYPMLAGARTRWPERGRALTAWHSACIQVDETIKKHLEDAENRRVRGSTSHEVGETAPKCDLQRG